VKVIENAVAGRLSVGEAAGLLQLSERQVQRLKRRYRPASRSNMQAEIELMYIQTATSQMQHVHDYTSIDVWSRTRR
jgi:hypothetical protein